MKRAAAKDLNKDNADDDSEDEMLDEPDPGDGVWKPAPAEVLATRRYGMFCSCCTHQVELHLTEAGCSHFCRIIQVDREAFLESKSKPSFAGLTLKPEPVAPTNGANGTAAGSSSVSAKAPAAPVVSDAKEPQPPAAVAAAAATTAAVTPEAPATAVKSPVAAAAAKQTAEAAAAAPSPAAAAPAAASPATSGAAAAAATDKAAPAAAAAAAKPDDAAAAAAADKPATEKKTVSLFGVFDANQTNPFQATFTATSGGFGSALASNSNSLFGSSAPGPLTAFTSFASSSAPKWGSPAVTKVC